MKNRVSAYPYHSRTVLLAGSVVDAVACLLVTGASYPSFGEALHACNPILVLPTSSNCVFHLPDLSRLV